MSEGYSFTLGAQGLRLSTTSNGGWAFTDYEINGTHETNYFERWN